MIEKLFNGFMEHGVLGLVVVSLAIYIIWIQKTHIKQQKEWQDVARGGFENIKENTGIIASLKTLIETTRERK